MAAKPSNQMKSSLPSQIAALKATSFIGVVSLLLFLAAYVAFYLMVGLDAQIWVQ